VPGPCTRNDPEPGGEESRTWKVEIRAVQRIEDFGAQVEAEAIVFKTWNGRVNVRDVVLCMRYHCAAEDAGGRVAQRARRLDLHDGEPRGRRSGHQRHL